MAHSKRYLAVGSLFAVVLMVLFACGGGGGGAGGGGGLDGNLFGAVTDATQTAVVGATVTVYDNTGTGTVVATTTTDAAGRYAFNITTMDDYLVSAEKAPAFFPAGRSVTLVANRTTVADLNLSSTRDRATQTEQSTDVVGSVGTVGMVDGEIKSLTYIGATERATLEIAADILETVPATLYPGTATVYLTPVDTTRMNSGFADYQSVLPVALGDPVPDGEVLKVYAAAGIAVVDTGGAALTTDVAAPMALSMPIQASLRAGAPAGPIPLWVYDPVQDSWSEAGSATRNVNAYEADISEGGLYAVGETAPATPVIGILQYSDATVAGGVTVMATAADATYRNVTTTAADGTFSVLVEDLMSADIEFVYLGSGVQQTDGTTIDLGAVGADLGTVVMTDITPAADATLKLAGISSTGFIPASGRIYVDSDSFLNTSEIADVVFVASAIGPMLTIESGKLGATLIDGTANNSIRLDGAVPSTITVGTVDGHSATITVNSATLNAGVWTVTMSSSFSL